MPQFRFGAAYLAFGAMACGQARTELIQEEAPPLVDIIPGAPTGPTAPTTPATPGAPASVPPELGQALPGVANDENVALGDTPRTDVIALRVLELLETYCGSCHANGEADGGFGDVLDIPKLIERGHSRVTRAASERHRVLQGHEALHVRSELRHLAAGAQRGHEKARA